MAIYPFDVNNYFTVGSIEIDITEYTLYINFVYKLNKNLYARVKVEFISKNRGVWLSNSEFIRYDTAITKSAKDRLLDLAEEIAEDIMDNITDKNGLYEVVHEWYDKLTRSQ